MVRVMLIGALVMLPMIATACTSAKVAQEIIVQGIDRLSDRATDVTADGTTTLVNPGFEWGFRAGMFNGPDASGFVRLTGTTAKIAGSMNAPASRPTTQPAGEGPSP